MCRSFRVIRNTTLSVALVFLVSSCALVPRESVELSTSVGRDVSAMYDAHRALATTLFGRIKGDVNRFVDTIYAPYQIQFVLARQKARQFAGDHNNLFSVLETSVKDPDNSSAQTDVLDFMTATVELVHNDIESYRAQRLAPILAQEREVLSALDRSYDRIQRGNAAVTAHLASIVKVNEAQDEILSAVQLDGLREKTGLALSEASSKIAHFVDTAKRVDGSLDQAKTKINDLTNQFDSLLAGD